MKKKYARVLGLLLAVVLVFQQTGIVQADGITATTSDQLKKMQQQIDKAEKERKELKSGLSDVKKVVAKLESAKSDLKEYVTQLDQEVAVIEEKIDGLIQDIAIKEQEIAETEIELENALAMEASQYDAMGQRIRLNYEQGSSFLVSLLLHATSFGEFLNRSTYVQAVADYDELMLEQFIETREYVELCKRTLEEEKLTLEATKESLENEEEALRQLIDQKAKEIEEYERNIRNNEAAIKEYEAEIAAQNRIIKDLEAAVEAERKRLLEQNKKGLIYDGGKFKFPLESYKRISDEYGWRIHPTLGVKQFHNGVDFAADKGTKIYAAYDGVVIAAAYSSTMGNYVMIDHGGGLYTIYMHASKLNVSKDNVVVKGQKIAEVGSTGRSTGNHLHFSVRLNGEYVSPWNYIKP